MKKFVYRVLHKLLAVLGLSFAACGKVEYGVPYSTFRVSGIVVDEQGEPIENIYVSPLYSESGRNQFTDSDGRFSLFGRNEGVAREIEVVFSDVDGAENGGNFEGKIMMVKLEDKTREPSKEDNSWYQGEFSSKDQTVILTKIK